MNWMEILFQIFEVALIPLIGVLTGYLIQFIRTKGNELNMKIENEQASKYIDMLTDTISACVQTTTQTYVDALKKAGTFDAEAQKKAFEMTKEAVLASLSNEAKKYLISIYGDFNLYLTNQIEATVRMTKVQ